MDPITIILLSIGGALVVTAFVRPFTIFPVDGVNSEMIGSRFGHRKDPFNPARDEFHNGQDFRVPEGTPLRSIGHGVVSFIIHDDRSGLAVGIRGTGQHAGHSWSYAHMSAANVVDGQEVAAGDIIGKSGNSGRSTGPHLHFRVNNAGGTAIDPLSVLPSVPQGGAS